jgi:hypothetical protein
MHHCQSEAVKNISTAAMPSALRTACNWPHFVTRERTSGVAASIAMRLLGHDYKDGEGPVRKHHEPAGKPPPIAGLPCRERAKQKANHRERRLHGEAAFVGRLPFRQQRPIVELKARRLFGDIYVDRGSGKQRGRNQSELAGKQDVTCRTGTHDRGTRAPLYRPNRSARKSAISSNR